MVFAIDMVRAMSQETTNELEMNRFWASPTFLKNKKS